MATATIMNTTKSVWDHLIDREKKYITQNSDN